MPELRKAALVLFLEGIHPPAQVMPEAGVCEWVSHWQAVAFANL